MSKGDIYANCILSLISLLRHSCNKCNYITYSWLIKKEIMSSQTVNWVGFLIDGCHGTEWV